MNNRQCISTGALAAAIAAALCAPASRAHDVYLRAESFPSQHAGGTAMWGYGKCDAGFTGCEAPTSPGPEIVVPPGDTSLTIHLQNNLREPTSIMIPGQAKAIAPVPFTDAQGRARIRAFDVEAAPGGGTQDYQWNNLRPGTYLYQSGSHVQLQVQMGLYGAMVQDAGANAAYTDVTYDRSRTLVFSEVDPVLHQTYTTPVQSSSFEAPDVAAGSESNAAAGWSVAGLAGAFDPAGDSVVAVTDGEQTGWVAGGGSLTLPAGTLGPDTSYQLSFDVGDRTDTAFAGYSAGLYAGGSPLVQEADAATPNGAFETRTLNLAANAPLLAGHYGQALEIRLAGTATPPAASSVAVAGSSFEAPAAAEGVEATTATNWSLTGPGFGGVFNPTADVVPQPTDGAQVAWSNGQRQLAQVLGETLAASTAYTLSVDVGDRSDTPFAGYRIALYASGALLGENVNAVTPDGNFQTASVNVMSPASVTAGQALEVRLASTASAPAATPLSIQNPSFEDPDVTLQSNSTPTSWQSNGVGTGGTYDPPAASPPLTPTAGLQAAWARGGREIQQTLVGVTLLPDTTYQLLVDVGDRSDTAFAGYRVALYAGTTPLAENANTFTPASGFQTSTVTYTTGATPPTGNLQVRLTGTGGNAGARTYFDNVRLSASTPDPNRTYFDKVVLTKSPLDTRRALFDKVMLNATATGKAANALDRAKHAEDGYQPRYFLINGEGNPTTLVTAAPGERVLLRLVNAGLQNRAPQLVGGYFEIVAEDGNKAPVARQQYGTLLPAGKSLDVMFTAPSVAGTYTLFDRRLGLSNGTGALGRIVVGSP